jgi:hypothetical protein
MQASAFRIFTVGLEPSYIEYFTLPIAARTGIRFIHGLVGDPSRVPRVKRSLPDLELVVLSKGSGETLPACDDDLLTALECPGIPTVKSMVQGDRVLRHRPEDESLGYATLLARRCQEALREHRPDVVLGTFDSLHSAIGLAVAKSLSIPWVALTYPVIPDDLTGFCKGLTPDTLVPLTRAPGPLRPQAAEIIKTVRSNRQHVVAYRPPVTLVQRARQYASHAKNLVRRAARSRELGYDRFTWPTTSERFLDIARRAKNRLRLPMQRMIGVPPTAPYAYFPLHMAPESSVDTWAPLYQDQFALIFQLSLVLPANFELVVKIHFGDPDNYSRRRLLELMKLARLRIARPDASGHLFLRQSALVFGIQGTASLEAALLGKPVLMFGHSPYLNFPRTQKGRRPDELHEQIRGLLEQSPPTDEEIEKSYAAYMARYMPGRNNDWGRPIEPLELERLSDCFRALQRYLEVPGNRASWYASYPFLSEPTAACPDPVVSTGTSR